MLLKKSLTHAGVLISLIILVVLLLANWNKCFVNPLEQWLRPVASTTIPVSNQKEGFRASNQKEGFRASNQKEGFLTDINTAVGKGIDARDITLDLNPAIRQVKVGFTGVFGQDVPADHVVRGYLLVMAKYDRDLNKVGSLDVKLTEENGGQTLATDLKTYSDKYSGSLTQGRKDKINDLRTANATAQLVLKAFLPNNTAVAQPVLADINDLPTQEIGMFFELLGLVYKYQMLAGKSLKSVYDELRVVYSKLPPANPTPTPNGDANYDYLQINISTTDKNKQAAADLTRAMNSFAELKTVLNLAGDPTMAFQPKKIIVDAVREFLQTLIKQIEAGDAQMVSNVCDPTTKKCVYTFTQVEPADTQGNIYYYKLGVGVIFVDTITGTEKLSKIKAYTFGQGTKLQYFRVDTNLDDQERLLKRLEDLERVSSQRALQQPMSAQDGTVSANGITSTSGINAYMNMLKPYIGNYPDEYLLGTEQGKELTLDRYLNPSLADGQINISADFSGLTPSTTAAAGNF